MGLEFLKKLLCSSKFFIILSVVVLYLGYSLNLWKATDYERYYDYKYSFIRNLNLFGQENFSDSYLTFDRWSESLVLGRLVKTRKDGLLSSGGFVGWFVDFPEPPDTVEERFFKQAYQYVLYFDNLSDHQAKEFRPYRSQVGGQAFFLGILDKVIPGTNIFKLKFFYHLMAFMTSLIVFLIIFWFYNEFGIITGWFLTISFGLSCYITLYAKSIWWILWAFYIPFLLMLYSLRKEEISNLELSLKTIILLTLVGMILKVFLNGYEFITPTVVMVSIPMFYYAIKKGV